LQMEDDTKPKALGFETRIALEPPHRAKEVRVTVKPRAPLHYAAGQRLNLLLWGEGGTEPDEVRTIPAPICHTKVDRAVVEPWAALQCEVGQELEILCKQRATRNPTL